MHQKLAEETFEEGIRIEQNVAALYALFSSLLPDDADFWWQLHLEEKSHANLLRAARDSFTKRGRLPEGILPDSLEELKQANNQISCWIDKCRANPPGRADACRIAIDIEQSAGESHYSRFMEQHPQSPLVSVFQQLNRDDKAHETRIRKHLDALSATV